MPFVRTYLSCTSYLLTNLHYHNLFRDNSPTLIARFLLAAVSMLAREFVLTIRSVASKASIIVDFDYSVEKSVEGDRRGTDWGRKVDVWKLS